MKKRQVFRIVKLFVLLFPVFVMLATLLGQGTFSIVDFNAELPTHDLMIEVSNWLVLNLGFNLGNFGEFALSYCAYILIVEMAEVVMNMLLCIPRICNKYLGGD